MTSVLFLAPDDLGETVLATGAVAHALGAGGSLTVVANENAAPLFRAAPGLSRLAPLTGRGGPGEFWRASLALMRNSYDVLVDARGGWPAVAAKARRRISLRTQAQVRHRVEDWADALGADRPLAPKIWLDEPARRQAARDAPGERLLLIAPGGASADKRWPWERFAAVARRLAGGALAGAEIVVLGAAARDAGIAAAIVASLDADGVTARDLGVGGDLLAAAALMERATLCVGNDNALTHIAAALGAPTLTLFGPTDERVRAPYGPRTRTFRARSLDAIVAGAGAGTAMEDIGIDAVETAALDLLYAGGLR